MYERLENLFIKAGAILKDPGEYGHEMEHMPGWNWNMMGGWGPIPMFLAGFVFILLIGLTLFYFLNLDRRQSTTVVYAPQPVQMTNPTPMAQPPTNYPQTKICPACETTVPINTRFCPTCGKRF